ncbi:hypothetical protein EYF80_033807 [Liparis tanakae]|uniref:Uncharacterized protein n=1 Tax=Liparis tanakae TaxID=230148 RepID=A0A4Z2GTB8_9TELE|nr:hypothetical protein EYF80_033807 [Liparis tanakae]
MLVCSPAYSPGLYGDRVTEMMENTERGGEERKGGDGGTRTISSAEAMNHTSHSLEPDIVHVQEPVPLPSTSNASGVAAGL